MAGKAYKFGDNINTDEIIPARYLNTTDRSELARHCMEDADASFAGDVKAGDVIIGGENFGCGSSREHAPVAIKAAGCSCVIAASFARIFYRNAINIGLPILECPEASAGVDPGDEIEIDLAQGTIQDLTNGRTFQSTPFPKAMRDIIDAGGLMAYVKSKA